MLILRTATALLLLVGSTAIADPADLPKIVVLELQTDAVAKKSAPFVNELILTELSKTHRYDVLGSSDVGAMIGLERQRQLLGCSEVAQSCLAELSGALGARYVISGALGSLGTTLRLDLKVIDTESTRVVSRVGGPVTEQNLADDAGKLVASLSEELVRAVPSRAGGNDAPVDVTATQSSAGAPLLPKVLVGVGAGAAIVGGALSYGAATFNRSLSYREAAQELSGAQRQSTIGYSLVGVGAAAAVTGLVWWMSSGSTASTSSNVSAAVLPAPDGSGAFVSLCGSLR